MEACYQPASNDFELAVDRDTRYRHTVGVPATARPFRAGRYTTDPCLVGAWSVAKPVFTHNTDLLPSGRFPPAADQQQRRHAAQTQQLCRRRFRHNHGRSLGQSYIAEGTTIRITSPNGKKD